MDMTRILGRRMHGLFAYVLWLWVGMWVMGTPSKYNVQLEVRSSLEFIHGHFSNPVSFCAFSFWRYKADGKRKGEGTT